MRIGLLGGSFDPIHQSHILMAKKAMKAQKLDEVWFILSQDTPLKDRKLKAYDTRLKWCELALKGYHHFKICTIEKDSKGKNYTIDTVKELKKRYLHDFYFIIGGDQVAQLDKWKDIEQLKKMVKFIAFPRDEYQDIPNDLIKMPILKDSYSSTMIRKGNLKGLPHSLVLTYLKDNSEILKNWMMDKRYEHSLRVADFAQKLAKCYQLDEEKAYLAGLLHDINKEAKLYSLTESKLIVEKLDKKLASYPSGCWHGMMGAFYLKHQLKVNDDVILKAIYHHVLGDNNSTMSIIIYLADKLELGRDYPKVEQYRKLAFKDYQKAYRVLLAVNKELYKEEK